MKSPIDLFEIATKIKTPLSLMGLGIVVLYLIVDKVLDMSIFSSIDSDKTYLILVNILDKVFIFSLIVLITGLLCYLIFFIHKKKSVKKSNVILIDAGNDERFSDYKEKEENGHKVIHKSDKDR
ncbi:hypothetical protein LJC57_01335 [Parabacteroides sp. OttesenSCG-928-G07]|nr:hypothetical protein [Parabacteroides sp. OttesenSCG-928-G07]